MSLLEERKKTAEAIAKGKFVDYTLTQQSRELNADIQQRMRSFSSAFWNQRNFSVSGNVLTYTTKKVHRFADMKTRQTKTGIITKKRYQIHNRPIFGHLNDIVRELNVGFTDAIKSKFMLF
jgi:hypothetical protein